jgi:hypothetical protein
MTAILNWRRQMDIHEDIGLSDHDLQTLRKAGIGREFSGDE